MRRYTESEFVYLGAVLNLNRGDTLIQDRIPYILLKCFSLTRQ